MSSHLSFNKLKFSAMIIFTLLIPPIALATPLADKTANSCSSKQAVNYSSNCILSGNGEAHHSGKPIVLAASKAQCKAACGRKYKCGAIAGSPQHNLIKANCIKKMNACKNAC